MKQDFRQGVEFSHDLFRKHLDEGASVIDATVGRGYDTEFLAKLVGKSGRVRGFDIQKQAIEATEKRLQEAKLEDRVELIQAGHEKLADHITESIDGILFNLGYLPGSNKEIITRPETTIQAVESGLQLLNSRGIIVLVVYLQHSGGRDEQKALLDYVGRLDMEDYNVLQYKFLNQENKPPQVIGIKKRGN